MNEFKYVFLEKNSSIKQRFIVYESLFGIIMLALLVWTFGTPAMYFVMVLGFYYAFDFYLNNQFVKDILSTNEYYSNIVISDPKKCTSSMNKTIQRNTETYLKRDVLKSNFKTTFLIYIITGDLNGFYSGLSRKIEMKRETNELY